MKKPKICILIFFSLFLICIAVPYVLPARVSKIYQGVYYDSFRDKKCMIAVITVDNQPFTKKGVLKLWRKERKSLKEKGVLLENKCDEIFFAKNKFVRPYSSQELKYWMGDNQICMRGVVNGRCINNFDVFMSISFEKSFNENLVIDKYQGRDIYISYR